MLIRKIGMSFFVGLTLFCFLVSFLPTSESANSNFTIDYDDGIHYLMYAYAAYCSPKYLSDWSCKWCGPNGANLTVTGYFNDSSYNLFGYIGYDVGQKAIFIAFRGTEESSLKNWILDLQSSKAPIDDPSLPGAKVESGFSKGWNNLKDQTMGALKQMLDQPQFADYSVICTGHSLGGALAVGAAISTGIQHPSVNVTLITFGQPRVGNDAFSQYITKYVWQTIRFINNRDMVPHLPLEVQGYHHAPREEWIRKGELYYCSPTDGEDPNCSDSLYLTTSIDDHLDYFGIEEDPAYAPPGSPYPGYCE